MWPTSTILARLDARVGSRSADDSPLFNALEERKTVSGASISAEVLLFQEIFVLSSRVCHCQTEYVSDLGSLSSRTDNHMANPQGSFRVVCYPSRLLVLPIWDHRPVNNEHGTLRSASQSTTAALPCICQTTASASLVDKGISSSEDQSGSTKLPTSACHKHAGPQVQRPPFDEGGWKSEH